MSVLTAGDVIEKNWNAVEFIENKMLVVVLHILLSLQPIRFTVPSSVDGQAIFKV